MKFTEPGNFRLKNRHESICLLLFFCLNILLLEKYSLEAFESQFKRSKTLNFCLRLTFFFDGYYCEYVCQHELDLALSRAHIIEICGLEHFRYLF